MGSERKFGRSSFFDGGLLPLIGWTILGFLVTVLSIGILYIRDYTKLTNTFISLEESFK